MGVGVGHSGHALLLAALAAAGLALAVSAGDAQAHSWKYEKETDAATGAVGVYAAFVGHGGGIGVSCKDRLLSVSVFFEHVAPAARRTVSVKWSVDKGEIMEFDADSIGNVYAVYPPKSRELAEILVGTSHLVTTNGGNEILQFDDLSKGEEIKRVLGACGY